MASIHPPPPRHYTPAQIRQWADDLARIRAVCRRKRIIGEPGLALERGCDVLERRLAEMREATQ